MKNRIAIEVYDPTGVTGLANVHAPRLGTLSGKTICELSNGSWEYDRTFALIRQLLQKRFPDVKIIPYTQFPIGMAEIDAEGIAEIVKAKGGDGVILGNAA